jgi:hypothetical protein
MRFTSIHEIEGQATAVVQDSQHDDPAYSVRAFVIYTADDDSGRRVAAEFIWHQ